MVRTGTLTDPDTAGSICRRSSRMRSTPTGRRPNTKEKSTPGQLARWLASCRFSLGREKMTPTRKPFLFASTAHLKRFSDTIVSCDIVTFFFHRASTFVRCLRNPTRHASRLMRLILWLHLDRAGKKPNFTSELCYTKHLKRKSHVFWTSVKTSRNRKLMESSMKNKKKKERRALTKTDRNKAGKRRTKNKQNSVSNSGVCKFGGWRSERLSKSARNVWFYQRWQI